MHAPKFLRERNTAFILIAPAVGLLGILSVYPLLYSLFLATRRYFLTKPWVDRSFVGLGNFSRLLADPYFLKAVAVLAKFALSAVTIEMAIGLALALLLVRWAKGRHLVKVLMLLPMMMVPVVAGLVWRLILNPNYGPANWFLGQLGVSGPVWLGPRLALTSVIGAEVWQWMPFSLLIFTVALGSVPKELYEEAAVDGASRLQTFLYVTLPRLRQPAAVILVFRLADAFKSFDKIFVMTGGGPGINTQTPALYNYYKGFVDFDMGYAASISFVLLITMLVMAAPLIRRALRKEEETIKAGEVVREVA